LQDHYSLDPVATFITGRQHNSTGFDVALKGITRADSKPTTTA
jgi:hypothetical protein